MSDLALAEKPQSTSGGSIGSSARSAMPMRISIRRTYMWKDYLPANLRDQAPQIEEGEDCDWIVFEGNRRPLQMINNQAGRTGARNSRCAASSVRHARCLGPVAPAEPTWTLDNIESAVLFGGGPLGTFNNELYMASYDAYSRWVMDFAAADHKPPGPRRLCANARYR